MTETGREYKQDEVGTSGRARPVCTEALIFILEEILLHVIHCTLIHPFYQFSSFYIFPTPYFFPFLPFFLFLPLFPFFAPFFSTPFPFICPLFFFPFPFFLFLPLFSPLFSSPFIFFPGRNFPRGGGGEYFLKYVPLRKYSLLM